MSNGYILWSFGKLWKTQCVWIVYLFSLAGDGIAKSIKSKNKPRAKTTCTNTHIILSLLGGKMDTQNCDIWRLFCQTLILRAHGTCSKSANTPFTSVRMMWCVNLQTYGKTWGWNSNTFPKQLSSRIPRPSETTVCLPILGWNHIGKCCEWICFRDCTEQACIRQNQSKILGVCFQFTSHAAANIHCSLRFLCFQS